MNGAVCKPATGASAGHGLPQLVRVASWSAYPWLLHGFSTRQSGVSTVYCERGLGTRGELNVGFTAEDDPAAVDANRTALARAVAVNEPVTPPLVLVRQVHGTAVHRVVRERLASLMEGGRALVEGDGLLTSEPGLLIGVQAADCVPVLLADTRLRMVCALHAGWRGTVAGIVGVGIRQMLALGSQVEDLTAAVGPSIGPCCYAVGDEVRARFEDSYSDAQTLFTERRGTTYLNLWESNRRQMVCAGVAEHRITVVAECSACSMIEGGRRYFSHRADQGRSGRMMGVIGLSGRE